MARTSPYDTGELTDVILVVLLCAQRPTHGYSLMTEASQITDGSMSWVQQPSTPPSRVCLKLDGSKKSHPAGQTATNLPRKNAASTSSPH